MLPVAQSEANDKIYILELGLTIIMFQPLFFSNTGCSSGCLMIS